MKRWIIGQIEEETHILHRTILLKILFEKTCSLHVYTHGCKNNGKVVGFLCVATMFLIRLFDQSSLSHNLCSYLETKAL